MTGEVEQMADPDAPEPVQEDFLFHLYRGSELLNDHRLLEAESELEYALTLEPGDARTLGLLAVVFFRRGLYARAIATYRFLLQDRPGDASLRLNLALCYLKTGESQGARALLEALVLENDGDPRTWGYLAVALERVGYFDQAREAFERAGHPDLALRMVERGAAPPAGHPGAGEAREALDGGELNVELVRADHEARGESVRPVPTASHRPPRHDTLGWGVHPNAAPAPQAWLEAPPLGNFIEDARVARLGDPPGVRVHGTRLARVTLDPAVAPMGFAFRLESLRSYSGTVEKDLLARQTRADVASAEAGSTAGETFGGIGTPFAAMKGPGELLVAPRASQRLVAFVLHDDAAFFREEALVGFNLSLEYENGRLGLAGPGGDSLQVVQLRGDGAVLLELSAELLAVEVRPGGLTVRKDVVVGWVGRLLPRSLGGEEAPGGQRGLLGFAGEGVVLVAAK